jgi:hypothetical protein
MISPWQCAWCEPPKNSWTPGTTGRVNYGICAACLKRCLAEAHHAGHGEEDRRVVNRVAIPLSRH